jgi:hypothetical protein
MLEFNAPGDFSDVGDDPDTISPESGEIMLGDIVLCNRKNIISGPKMICVIVYVENILFL